MSAPLIGRRVIGRRVAILAADGEAAQPPRPCATVIPDDSGREPPALPVARGPGALRQRPLSGLTASGPPAPPPPVRSPRMTLLDLHTPTSEPVDLDVELLGPSFGARVHDLDLAHLDDDEVRADDTVVLNKR